MKQELENYFNNLLTEIGECGCEICVPIKTCFNNKKELVAHLLDGNLFCIFSTNYPNLKKDLISFLASSNKSARHTFGDLLGET